MKLREIYRFSNGMKMVDGTLCWNLNGLFEEIKAGMRECKKLGINPESMGIDTWAVDFVLLDKQGHVLGKTAGYSCFGEPVYRNRFSTRFTSLWL